MKLAVALTGIFLSITTLVSAAASVNSRSVLAGCDGQVTGNSTVDYNGNPIGHVTATCPQSGSKKRSKLEDRGYYNLCTEGNCYVTCEATSTYSIYLSDCNYVLEYLASYASSTIDVPAGTYHEWYYGSCGIYFYNFDVYDYVVCYAEVAYDADGAGNACVGKTNGAICSGSGKAGDAYEIVIASA